MKIQQSQSSYQAPNFKGTLFSYAANRLNPTQVEHLTKDLTFLSPNFKANRGALAVIDSDTPVIGAILKLLCLKPRAIKVPDAEIAASPIEALTAKYLTA